MRYYLWELRPYFRQVAGQLVLGSIAGFVMNTAIVLPAILLGQAIDVALAFERGEVSPGAVGWAALAFVGGTLLTDVPRIAKRWWLMTANARMRANIRADAWRGVIGVCPLHGRRISRQAPSRHCGGRAEGNEIATISDFR